MGMFAPASSGDTWEDVATMLAEGRYADLGELTFNFIGETSIDMAAACLTGGAGLETTLFKNMPGLLASKNAIALGFQAQTSVDIYNGLADRDVNTLVAMTGALAGGRAVAALEQVGVETLFGAGKGLRVGKVLAKEIMPNTRLAASATR